MCHSCKEELAQPAPDTPSAELLYPPTLHASIRPQAYELKIRKKNSLTATSSSTSNKDPSFLVLRHAFQSAPISECGDLMDGNGVEG